MLNTEIYGGIAELFILLSHLENSQAQEENAIVSEFHRKNFSINLDYSGSSVNSCMYLVLTSHLLKNLTPSKI